MQEALNTPATKVDLRHSDKNVVFRITDCCTDKRYSFYNGLTRESSDRLLAKLKHFEKYTWRQMAGLTRDQGLTVEKDTSESYAMIHEQNNCPSKITERYYFHIRVEKAGKFRIFGYQEQYYFYITHIDYSGKIHHT